MFANDLGQFVAKLSYTDLPPAVIEAAKCRILDLIGVAIGGSRLGNFRPLHKTIESTGNNTIWGLDRGYTMRDAALLNSFLAHSTYLDDGSRFTGGHPSSVVIPSSIALAENQEISGRDLITSVVAGYEVFLRLGSAIYPSTVGLGFQSTAVVGAAASAAACARLLQLNASQTKNAIAIACNLGTGLKEAMKAPNSQPLQVARSCEAGLQCALYAREGAIGADSIIEHGLLHAFSTSPPTIDTLNFNLGKEYRIAETYIKLHGGCRGNHAPIDVIAQLVATHNISLHEIQQINIAVDSIAWAHLIHPPQNGLQAQFSIPFAVAVFLLEGNATVFQYTDMKVQDSRVQHLMQKINTTRNPELDAGFPNNRGAHAEILTSDGKRFSSYLNNARGEPEYPLTIGEITTKFLTLSNDVLGAHCAEVIEAVNNLETLKSSRQLTNLLVGDHTA